MSDYKRQQIRKEEDRHVFVIAEQDILLSYEGPGGTVKIPEGVKYIGKDVFSYCGNVTEVILPEGLKLIGERAFYKSGIRNISLPESLEKIGESAFADTPLESIEIPAKVNAIGEQAFSGAEHLKDVRLPEGIKSLDPGLFAGCTALEEIVIPGSVKHIEARAFINCTSLRKIDLPEGLVSVWHHTFEGCSSLEEVYLGNKVRAIGRYAFRNCTKLKKVRVPKKLETFGYHAFEGADDLILEGPGQKNGLLFIDDEIQYCSAGLKTVVIPKGVEEVEEDALGTLKAPEVFDLPKSLIYYSWTSFAQFGSLKKIVTDRKALAAEIACMLDLECTDRKGKPFTYKAPEGGGEWITESDGKEVIVMGCTGRAGHTGDAEYTTVMIPEEINGLPVAGIGPEAFCENDTADAFYIPDTVKFIESRAFADMGYCRYGEKVFMRMPEGIRIADDAFAGTRYFTKKDAVRTETKEKQAETAVPYSAFAEAAADDYVNGTGTKERIWQYFDSLGREERIRELTHSFSVSAHIDGVGWASVKIRLDNESAGFRISYIGSSPADFRRFAAGVADGETESFGWAGEPGSYRWTIRRRGGILHVTAPKYLKSFFISREEFLLAVQDMKDEWRDR